MKIGTKIAIGMIVGIILVFVGLGWDQSFTLWKGKLGPWVSIFGFVLFAGAIGFLIGGSRK